MNNPLERDENNDQNRPKEVIIQTQWQTMLIDPDDIHPLFAGAPKTIQWLALMASSP